MNKIREVIKQAFSHKTSYRKIAINLNICVATIANYVARAKQAGITSWPLASSLSNEELYDKLFGKKAKDNSAKKDTDIDWDEVHKEMRRKGVTRQLLWEEYKETHPDGLGYTQFCLYYSWHKETLDPVMRQAHTPGEKCFVDYAGATVPLINSETGEITKAQIFVGCLGASSYTYVEATRSQKVQDWIGSNKRMFEFFGGVPAEVVPDNLKSGVKKADRYDPDLNPAYQEFGRHYKTAIMPARVVAPRDKAAAESAVHFVTTKILAPLRNKKFYSLAALNEAIWERLKILNHGSFQKKKTSRQALFLELDKAALQPLPSIPYEYGDWKKAKVNIDYHIAYDDHNYSVPYIYCGKRVMLRATAKTIECYLDNERIAVHARSYEKYKHTTFEAHMPKSHQEQAKWTPETIADWAKRIGPETAKLLTMIIGEKDYPQQGFRPCLGILRLSEKYGAERLEKASVKALSVGMRRYREIKEMLKNNLETVPIESTTKPPPKHSNIRGSSYYQKVLTEGGITC